jgi:hypothetical protein
MIKLIKRNKFNIIALFRLTLSIFILTSPIFGMDKVNKNIVAIKENVENNLTNIKDAEENLFQLGKKIEEKRDEDANELNSIITNKLQTLSTMKEESLLLFETEKDNKIVEEIENFKKKREQSWSSIFKNFKNTIIDSFK